MKKKTRIPLWGAVVIVILLALILAPYRLPGGGLRSFRKEIRYQFIDLGQGDFILSNTVATVTEIAKINKRPVVAK
jgi:hypothetical protein